MPRHSKKKSQSDPQGNLPSTSLSEAQTRELLKQYLLTYGKNEMEDVIDYILLFRKYNSFPVLIIGETGSGKEMIARFLAASDGNIAKYKRNINNLELDKDSLITELCSVSDSRLLESELFGHIRGAFTDAIKDHDGLFGSKYKVIFLDEIGKSPERLQYSLYRYIEYNEGRKVGDNKITKFDPPKNLIFAALPDELAAKNLRSDFVNRIRKSLILMPNLRSRFLDIPLMVQYFLDSIISEKKLQDVVTDIDSMTMWFILSYSWPDNIRELRQFLERAIIENQAGVIRLLPALRYFSPHNYDVIYDTLLYSKMEGGFVDYYIGCRISKAKLRLGPPSNDYLNVFNQFGARLYPIPKIQHWFPDMADDHKDEVCQWLMDICSYSDEKPKLFPIKEITRSLEQLISSHLMNQRVISNSKWRPDAVYPDSKDESLFFIGLYNKIEPGKSLKQLSEELGVKQTTLRDRMRRCHLYDPRPRRKRDNSLTK